ncbi:hypothetical protein ALC57_07538, partial [Trachymyrmex cornetzi]
HGTEGVNATGTELDRFDRVQALDREGALGKDRRKSGGTSLRPEAPNEPRGPNWVSVPRGRTLTLDVQVRSYNRGRVYNELKQRFFKLINEGQIKYEM